MSSACKEWCPAFEKYKKATKRTYQFVTMLCCFTLLGAQCGRPALTLSVKIRRNRQEYGVLQDRVRTALGVRVTEQLVKRIGDTLPPSPAHDMASIGAIDQDIRSLAETYHTIRQAGGESQDLKEFLNNHPLAGEPDLSATELADEAEETALRVEGLERKSYSDIKKSEEIIQQVEGNSPSSAAPDAVKKLTLELFKCLKDSGKKRLLESFIKELPILGPVSDILSSALDKSAQAYIDQRADKIAADIKERFDLEMNLSREAQSISRAIKVRIDERVIADEKRAVSRWQMETRTIVILKSRAAREVLRAESARNPPQPSASSIEASTSVEKPSRKLSDDDRMEELRRGIEEGWVVTRNSRADPYKLFVHASGGIILTDLRYLIRESPDGGEWTVYLPQESFGGSSFGRPIGTIPRPSGVSVGECDCE